MTMAKFWKVIPMAALMLVAMVSCNSDDEMSDYYDDGYAVLPQTATPIPLTEAQQHMRDNNNEFAWRLFSEVQQTIGNHDNSVISPLSVTYLLGMMDAGAAGNTRDEITAALGLGDDVMAVNEYCKTMIDGAASVDLTATVRIANCIDINSALGFSLLPQYVDDMAHYYNAQIDALDFTNSSTLDKINNWCKDNTDGMIPRILDELYPDMAMCMLNAIYFKADWTSKFNKKNTRKMDFTLANGTTAKREIMHMKARTLCGQNDTCSVLRLPFGNGAYSMYVLLPAEGVTLDELIKGMSAQNLNERLNNVFTADVDILLPKFEVSSNIDLIEMLQSLGVTSAFDNTRADFSNMTSSSVCVSKMLQKAKIEIDEDGGKAAAITLSGFVLTSYLPIPNLDFHATKPFLYVIREESTRSIFFMGTYCGS